MHIFVVTVIPDPGRTASGRTAGTETTKKDIVHAKLVVRKQRLLFIFPFVKGSTGAARFTVFSYILCGSSLVSKFASP